VAFTETEYKPGNINQTWGKTMRTLLVLSLALVSSVANAGNLDKLVGNWRCVGGHNQVADIKFTPDTIEAKQSDEKVETGSLVDLTNELPNLYRGLGFMAFAISTGKDSVFMLAVKNADGTLYMAEQRAIPTKAEINFSPNMTCIGIQTAQ
jgi:hypothetical protein